MNNIFHSYFVIFRQPIKYVFVRLSLVCFDATAPDEARGKKLTS